MLAVCWETLVFSPLASHSTWSPTTQETSFECLSMGPGFQEAESRSHNFLRFYWRSITFATFCPQVKTSNQPKLIGQEPESSLGRGEWQHHVLRSVGGDVAATLKARSKPDEVVKHRDVQ